jgi:hypothetical protein
MSSTTNTQNLLTNVFRPTFVYNTVTGNYQMKLELTNVDIVSANTVTSFAANIGDENGNLYLGTGSGNAYSTLVTSSNSTNTFVGTGAGGATSNVKNGVFVGYRAGYGASNSSNSISIGANTLNGGNSNIYIGYATGIATGSNNIFLGAGVSNGGASTCNTLIVGSGANTMLFGDLVNRRLAVNQTSLADPSTFIVFDVNGYTRIGPPASGVGGLGINTNPGQGFTLDVNGNARISSNLQVSNGFFSASGTVTVQSGNSAVIGVWKKGISVMSAQSDGGDFATRMDLVSAGGPALVTMFSSNSTTTTLTRNTSNIVLSNTTGSVRSYSYSITYFPSP